MIESAPTQTEREPHYAQVPREALPALPRQPVHVVLDNLRSAYNIGSVFRTGDGGAVAHIHICGFSARPPHKKLEKTALGACDYVPWSYHTNTPDCLAALRAEGIPIVAVEVTPEAVPYTRFDWPQPVAIVFGHEVDGISADTLALCDAVVQIPMHGYKNSMNVSTAFGVLLYGILQHWKAV